MGEREIERAMGETERQRAMGETERDIDGRHRERKRQERCMVRHQLVRLSGSEGYVIEVELAVSGVKGNDTGVERAFSGWKGGNQSVRSSESTITSDDRGSTFALRRSTVDFCLGGQHSSISTFTREAGPAFVAIYSPPLQEIPRPVGVCCSAATGTERKRGVPVGAVVGVARAREHHP
jgi:hypothetical protein